jgi:hypothetical protein
MKIELGDQVKCIHSGFMGVAIERTIFINECVQYAIMPKVDSEGKMPEGVGIDEQSLKVIRKNKNNYINRKFINIELGDKVQCKHTGFIGIVVAKTEVLNGSINYNVLPKIGKDKKMPEEICIDQINLRILIKKKKPVKKKEKEPFFSKRTGGPMNRNLSTRRIY